MIGGGIGSVAGPGRAAAATGAQPVRLTGSAPNLIWYGGGGGSVTARADWSGVGPRAAHDLVVQAEAAHKGGPGGAIAPPADLMPKHHRTDAGLKSDLAGVERKG